MTPRPRRKSRTVAPATVFFGHARDEGGCRQLAVWAECVYSGLRVGPVWAHGQPSVRRCLATLTQSCDCGRSYHRAVYTEGYRVSAGGRGRRQP